MSSRRTPRTLAVPQIADLEISSEDRSREEALRQLRDDPEKIIQGARRGVNQHIIMLSNFWVDPEIAPRLVNMGLFSIFYDHLKASLVPARTAENMFTERAIHCLNALANIGNLTKYAFPDISLQDVEAEAISAWPGIFEWCKFIYKTRVASELNPPMLRRLAMDMIGNAMFSFLQFDDLREVMANTPGLIELATRLWRKEDTDSYPSTTPIPVHTGVLNWLFIGTIYPESGTVSEDEKKARYDMRCKVIGARLDRLVDTDGAGVSTIFQLLFTRLRDATADGSRINESVAPFTVDLVGRFCSVPSHPLEMRILGAGIIGFITKLAVTIVALLDKMGRSLASIPYKQNIFEGSVYSPHDRYQGLVVCLAMCFRFLEEKLESTDGFTWVAQSVSAGLLQAWTGANRHMLTSAPFLHKSDAVTLLKILDNILPRYMVYKSIINVVNGALKKLDGVSSAEWESAEARTAWDNFKNLAAGRNKISLEMKTLKSAVCDNYKNCHNRDLKNNFMKCAACNITLYCSRECQKYSWKEGGHRELCKMQQREISEGKSRSISKTDVAFFHHLATSEARNNLRYLRSLSEEAFQVVVHAPTAMILSTDYTAFPPKRGYHPLADHEKRGKPVGASTLSTEDIARNDELLQRARDNPQEYCIVQSQMSNGIGTYTLLSIVPSAILHDLD